MIKYYYEEHRRKICLKSYTTLEDSELSWMLLKSKCKLGVYSSINYLFIIQFPSSVPMGLPCWIHLDLTGLTPL